MSARSSNRMTTSRRCRLHRRQRTCRGRVGRFVGGRSCRISRARVQQILLATDFQHYSYQTSKPIWLISTAPSQSGFDLLSRVAVPRMSRKSCSSLLRVQRLLRSPREALSSRDGALSAEDTLRSVLGHLCVGAVWTNAVEAAAPPGAVQQHRHCLAPATKDQQVAVAREHQAGCHRRLFVQWHQGALGY